MTRTAYVVLAGGGGTRLGAGVNKTYLLLNGRPVVSWSLDWVARVPEISRIVMVIRPQDEALARRAIAAADLGREPVELVRGGDTRHGSEQAALEHLRQPIAAGLIDIVAVHDGARPLAGADLLRTVITAAAVHGGAVPAIPEQRAWAIDSRGALLMDGAGVHLRRAQTPQAFRARPLAEAYAAAIGRGTEGTDTAATMEARPDVTVVAVPGSPRNLKVTYPEDLAMAERLLQGEPAVRSGRF